MSDDDEETSGNRNFLVAAMNKLPPKLIFILIILALVLLSGIITVAVYRDSKVDLFGIKISPGADIADSIPNIRMNIRFEPDDVNPRDPRLKVTAFKKAIEGGRVPLLLRQGVEHGSIYVDLKPPDLETPFFVVIESTGGTWQTEDISLKHSFPTAYRTPN